MNIYRRFKLAGSILLGTNRRSNRSNSAGRGATVYPDDIFITSYPKSGNTWACFLVSNLLYSDDGHSDFWNIAKRVPSIYWDNELTLKALPRPRVLKSHEYFDPRYPKVLFIVRDVRAVLVSYYHFQLRMKAIKAEVTLPEFARRFLSGKLDKYGTWRENVTSWVRIRSNDHSRFCLIRYEDLKSNGKEALKKVVSFLNLKCSEDQIETVLEMSSLERMRKMEEQYFQKNPEVHLGQGEKADVSVVRSGKVDGWKHFLDKETLDLIKADSMDVLLELGYEW